MAQRKQYVGPNEQGDPSADVLIYEQALSAKIAQQDRDYNFYSSMTPQEAAAWRRRGSEIDAEGRRHGKRRTEDETGYAKGGKVKGKGSKDTVKARLTPGEFVVKKSAAKNNMGLLNRLNRTSTGPTR